MDSHPALQFTPGFSEASGPVRTFHLRDVYSPKAPPQRPSVSIRPPSPKPDPIQEPTRPRRPSCEPEPKPIMRRRARSLSSCDEHRSRSPQVRFVDSLGLDLEDVRVFRACEDPRVPVHVTTRLQAASELTSRKKLELSLPYFQPSFPQNMASESGFLQRLSRQSVCLQQVFCSELGIMGNVQVLNVAYEKEVTVRYSYTDWRSAADCTARWICSVRREGLDSDVFRFHLPVPPFITQPGSVLQFAVRFRARGLEYWDNNGGRNYTLTCETYKLTVPRECEDSLVHFT